LYIIGDGPEKTRLKELSARMRIGEKCQFLGWLNSEKVNEYYNRCELFVFPSAAEYFPNVLVEALASRIPIVTVENESYRWIVGDAAVFCQPNIESLAEGILDVLRDRERRLEMKEACVKADFRMKRILNRQLSQLHALLNRSKGVS